MDDVQRLEVLPHGMRRISESPVRESVRGHQVTEFVVNRRQRGPDPRNPRGEGAIPMNGDVWRRLIG
jgi:hypothetical protein